MPEVTLRVLAIQNDPTAPPGLVGEWLEARGVALRVVAAFAGDAVPDAVPADVDALLSLGGEMGALADDAAPWLPAERALLRDGVARDVPILGLCLGGQLLAAALGGRVGPSVVGEAGVVEMTATADVAGDPAFGSLAGRSVRAAQWHLDAVEELPSGATLLLSNEACPVQAFRVGGFAWGLQFHPEVDADIVESWVSDDAPLVAAGVSSSDAVEQVREAYAELVATWRPVIDSWVDVIAQQVASPTP